MRDYRQTCQLHSPLSSPRQNTKKGLSGTLVVVKHIGMQGEMYVMITRPASGQKKWANAQGNRTKKVDCVHFELPEFKNCRFNMYFLMRPSELLTPVTTSHIPWLKAFHPALLHAWWMWKRGMYLKCFHLASFIFRKLVCWYFQTHISRKLFPCPRTGYLYGIKLLYSSHAWHICKCVIWVGKDAVNSLYCVAGTSEVLQHFYCLFHEMFFYLQCAFFSPFICGWFCFGLVFSGVWNERRKSLKIPEFLEKSFKDTISHFLFCWQEDMRGGYWQGARVALLFIIARKSYNMSAQTLQLP